MSTPHALASRAGAQALRDGGTAVDAALAAAAVLAVVYPNQCSIGGDLIALVGLPDGAAHVVNASGRSPAGLDPDALRSRLSHVPVDGATAVTVPGVIAGWHELARRWGRRPLPATLTQAAALARDGVPVSAGLARDLEREADRIAADPGLAQVLMPGGATLTAGATLRQPRLADTLDAIAAGGPDAFYTGEVAASLVRTLRAGGSAMTTDDLAAHRGTIETPPTAVFAGEQYLSSGGNTQGGFFLAGLRVLDVLTDRLGTPLDPSGGRAGLLARVLARLAVERDARLGDPARSGHPGPQAPADDWLASLLAGDDGPALLADQLLTEAAAGSPACAPGRTVPGRPSGDTVAIVAADAEGRWVCVIQSVFHAFGAGLLDPVTGVLLHNRGAAFDLRPGSAGELAGGRRPPHTLMPVLVRDRAGGRFVGAHGTMGGRAQPQIHTHLAVHLQLGRTPAEAVGAPRWIVGQMEAGEIQSPVLQAEADVPGPARAGLAEAGLPIRLLERHDDGVGHAQLIRATAGSAPDDGHLQAASDPRADGTAWAEEA